MLMPAYDIGIVIVSYNVRHFLERCLQSIDNACKSPLKVEIWVVDNASVDGTARMVQEHFSHVHFIGNENNVGFSTANNQAIRQMDSKYVLLLNPDTIIEEDTLMKCFNFMEQHPAAGVMGVRMIDGAGKFLPESKRSVPNLWNSFCKLFFLSDMFPESRRFSGYNLGYLPEMETNKIEVLCGAFMFIRAETLTKVGLLDEDFFMYGEDIDLSYRILQGGYEVWYFPQTTILHYKGESTKKGSFNYIKTFYGAMQIYVDKHYGKGDAGIFAKVIKLAVAIRGLISGISSATKAIFHPLVDFILLMVSLNLVKTIWADSYFQDTHYFSDSPIYYILIGYALIWVLVLWFNGYYEYFKAWRNRLISIITGMLIILIFYALLPESLRTSRAIILIGGLLSFPVLSLSYWLMQYIKTDKSKETEDKSVAIVASMKNAEKLKTIINTSGDSTNVYYIAPNESYYNGFFTTTLNNLPHVARKLKINEVIFGSEDVLISEIINSMTGIGAGVSFKIGSADTLKIIGSGDRNTQGDLMSFDIKYRLDETHIRRLKRLLDICIALLMIPLSPLWMAMHSLSTEIFKWIGNIFSGKNTWIGYGGTLADYEFLPSLPSPIFPLITTLDSGNSIRETNTAYAKNYSILYDVKWILKHLF